MIQKLIDSSNFDIGFVFNSHWDTGFRIQGFIRILHLTCSNLHFIAVIQEIAPTFHSLAHETRTDFNCRRRKGNL